jgi:hypothetical protein
MRPWAVEPQQTSSVDSPCSPIYADDFVRRRVMDFRIPTTALDEASDELSSVE